MEIAFERLTTPEELAAVRKIASEVWPETFAPILTQEQIRYMMRMMYAPEVMERELGEGYCFDLVRVDGELAGYLVYSAYRESGTAKLHKVYLRSRFHGKGIGKAMLEHACDRCREAGFSSVILTVNKQNFKAQKAYFRFGFVAERAETVDIGSGFVMDDYVMRKNLTAL